MLDFLFVHRGRLLALPALVLWAASAPTVASLGVGAVVAGMGLALRASAVAVIGPVSRTRDPRPPERWVTGGPYRLRHPLYLANLAVAAGLVIAARPSPAIAAAGLGSVAVFYAALAWREERERWAAPASVSPSLRFTAAQVARAERSTWYTMAIAGALLVARL